MDQQGSKTAKATALIVISSCSFGALSTLTVFATHAGLTLLPTMFWRYLLAAIALLLILRRGALKIDRTRAIRLIVVGGFAQALITYLSLRALDFLPVGQLAFLFYTYPAWLALISAATGREELTLPRLAALAIAMAGIVLMVGAPDSATLNRTGIILALGTAFLYALYLPALHEVQKNISPALSSFYLILGVLIAFSVASLAAGGIEMPHSSELWGYLLLLSLVSTVLAFASLVAGLRILGPVRTSIVATIEPFFTTILGILLLGEQMTRSIGIGGVLIASAVLLLQWTSRTRKNAERDVVELAE
jgi:drug/metabolite transporter (DMT)-like permease